MGTAARLAVLLLLLAASSARVARCAGLSDLARFLAAHPEAKRLEWRAAADRPRLVLSDVHDDQKREKAIAVFDPAGRCVYERAWRNEDGVWRRLGSPRILTLGEPVLAFTTSFSVSKTTIVKIVLLGVKDGRPVELELDHSCSSSYPCDYHFPHWLEDIDGDGSPEVCGFVRGKLRCHDWEPEAGQWVELRRFAGSRLEARYAPLQWRVSMTKGGDEAEARLDLEVTSLVECPLTLSPPLESIGDDLGDGEATRAAAGSPFALKARPKRKGWGPQEQWLRVRRDRPAPDEITLDPQGTRRVSFLVELPPGQQAGRACEVFVSGRARWRCWEASCGVSVVVSLNTQAPQPERSQAEFDEATRRAIQDKAWIPPSRLSTATRRWLLSRVPSNWELALLNGDMADETGRLALEALKKGAGGSPWPRRELLLLALRRRGPAQYKDVLREAGGTEAGLGPALLSLLREPESECRSRFIHTFLDQTALAAALAAWPDPQVAAEARAVLEKLRDGQD